VTKTRSPPDEPSGELGRLDLAGEVYDLFVDICPVVLAVTLAEATIRPHETSIAGFRARCYPDSGFAIE
jgi:hypothetical protein